MGLDLFAAHPVDVMMILLRERVVIAAYTVSE